MTEDNWEKSRRIAHTWGVAQSGVYAESRGYSAEHHGQTSEALGEYRLAVSEFKSFRERFPGFFDAKISELEQEIKNIEQHGSGIANEYNRQRAAECAAEVYRRGGTRKNK